SQCRVGYDSYPLPKAEKTGARPTSFTASSAHSKDVDKNPSAWQQSDRETLYAPSQEEEVLKNSSRKTGQVFRKASSESDRHPPTKMTTSSMLKRPTRWFSHLTARQIFTKTAAKPPNSSHANSHNSSTARKNRSNHLQ